MQSAQSKFALCCRFGICNVRRVHVRFSMFPCIICCLALHGRWLGTLGFKLRHRKGTNAILCTAPSRISSEKTRGEKTQSTLRELLLLFFQGWSMVCMTAFAWIMASPHTLIEGAAASGSGAAASTPATLTTRMHWGLPSFSSIWNFTSSPGSRSM